MSALGEQVGTLFEERRFAEALPVARAWVRAEPEKWSAHADLAVAAKHARSFAECRAAAVRAIELGGTDVDTGVHWNLGVAATALGEWPLARRGWSACGIKLPPGDGPFAMSLGPTPIRVGPPDAQEVVWCERIDPARAIVRSVPMPESGRRCGDLVLHDGEPRGKRRWREREVSVFDELCLLERSPFRTSVLVVRADTAEDCDALLDLLADVVEAVEDWSASLEVICKACSEGRPHEHHDAPPLAWSSERRIAIASRDPIEDALLARWDVGVASRAIVRIEETD